MNNAEVIVEFNEAQAILRGHFVLSSGLHSDTYLQCARVLMNPKRAERLCRALADKVLGALFQQSIDVVVAPAMGGVVVGYEMARQLHVEGVFCERENDVFALRRGFTIKKGARVLLVEDVVTTGKSSLEAVACIEVAGGQVVAEASLIDRSGGAHGLPFPLISLLTLDVKTYAEDALPPHLQAIPVEKPGSRFLQKTA